MIETPLSCSKAGFVLALRCGGQLSSLSSEPRKHNSFMIRSLGHVQRISYSHPASLKGSELWAPGTKVVYSRVVAGYLSRFQIRGPQQGTMGDLLWIMSSVTAKPKQCQAAAATIWEGLAPENEALVRGEIL